MTRFAGSRDHLVQDPKCHSTLSWHLRTSNQLTSSTITDVLRWHSTRDFGESGFRDIAITVFNRNETAFMYEVLHIWKVEKGACSSLFLLTQPRVLSGTAIILVERPYVSAMEIWFRLRSGEQPVRMDASRCDQLVLGTDFTYSDLRFWFPTSDFTFNQMEFIDNSGKLECILNARRQPSRTPSLQLRLTLDATCWLPLRMEWFELGHDSPRRVYSARNLLNCNGIWTPRAISVSRPQQGYRTEMTLRRLLHNAAIESSLFRTDNLAHLHSSTFDELASLAQVLVDV
jgi:hypothetical protein